MLAQYVYTQYKTDGQSFFYSDVKQKFGSNRHITLQHVQPKVFSHTITVY